MKKQSSVTVTHKKKVIIISALYTFAIIIIFLGMFFSIFSLVNHISFKILSSSVPGAIFGLLVLYLGIRYYLSLVKLKEELFKSSSKFSWNNFKSKKFKKLVSKK
jgi:hypothetical protein